MKTIITKEEIEKLYISENKTDKEIAELFSTSSFCIWNLRKKYGIKGIREQARKIIENPQAEITKRQTQIILGSLLGDCCIKRRPSSAYLSISHTIKHKEYTDWLYEELKSICPATPKQYISKGKYITYWFISESRKDLKEMSDKIYTPTKRINEWWINQIEPLGLAIWFMDDGSMTYVNKNKSAYSFATNSFTEEENYMLAKMLKTKFDLNIDVKPYNKKTGMQYNLFVADDSFQKFTDIVSPYIVNCMNYKIPCKENKLHWQENIECKISKETLDRLYNKEMFTQEQIAAIFNLHKCTIRKYMDIFEIKPRDNIAAQIGGKNNKCERVASGQFSELQITEEQEKKSQELFKEIRENSFPYPVIKQEAYYIGILDRLHNIDPLSCIDGTINDYSRAGMDICSAYCPQIFSMSANKSLSPIEIFNNDGMLMDCIRRTLKYSHKDSIAAVRQGLKTYRKNRCVTVFPPMWAKTAISLSCSGKNLSVLDFSCGFGGRLIGSYCSSIVNRYVGIDPLKENINSGMTIGNIIKKHSELKNINFSSELINNQAELALPSINEKFDIIITSPPYFSKERYSKDNSQCYIKYNTYETWKKEWLDNILMAAYEKLNDNGHMIIFASNYDWFSVGFDCRDTMRNISKTEPTCIKFGLPTLEYLRNKNIKKYDTAWIIQKPTL